MLFPAFVCLHWRPTESLIGSICKHEVWNPQQGYCWLCSWGLPRVVSLYRNACDAPCRIPWRGEVPFSKACAVAASAPLTWFLLMRGLSATSAQHTKSGFKPSEWVLGGWAANADGGSSRLPRQEWTSLHQTCARLLVVLNFSWRLVPACPVLQREWTRVSVACKWFSFGCSYSGESWEGKQ